MIKIDKAPMIDKIKSDFLRTIGCGSSKSSDKLAMLLEYAQNVSPEILLRVKEVNIHWIKVCDDVVVPDVNIKFNI